MKEIIYREVEELVLLEDNPRKISDEQMERLKESIDKNPDYFECRPVILSDRTGELVVIAGNQRVKAATAIGLKAVPTILLSGLTEEREKEIIIRDNVNNGEWDEELLAEWDAALLDDWGVDISALSEKDFLQVGEENYGDQFTLPSGEKDKFGIMNFTVTEDQRERINLALDAAVYCEGYCEEDNKNQNGAALDLIVKEWVLFKMEDISQEGEEELAKRVDELRQYLCDSLSKSGHKASDIDSLLGTNGMSGHYFGKSQWMWPTREAYEAMKGIMDLPRDYFECAKVVSAYNFVKKIKTCIWDAVRK